MPKVLLLGNGAREHAIACKLKENSEVELVTIATAKNPGIFKLSSDYLIGDYNDPETVKDFAEKHQPELAFIGPEAPLGEGIADALEGLGIGCAGPVKYLAQLETSKNFTRSLLKDAGIEANPKFKNFKSEEGLRDFIEEVGQFVVKPDGLTGGKGVQVMGDHFKTAEEGYKYALEVLKDHPSVVIEEKLVGQEFSLMSFCDGTHLAHMPVAQDNKRAFVNDDGPNTGGMGSVSFADHSQPFLTPEDLEKAKKINQQVADALKTKDPKGFKGILYGNFIAVKNGVKIIEYNARFGDPEAMNVLSILKTDLYAISKAIVEGNLNEVKVEFEPKATVCKYAVPEGYPGEPVKDVKIDLSDVDLQRVKVYYAAIDAREDGLYLTGSRAVAIVGVADTIEEAEKQAEEEIKKIKGPVFHREDIGTRELIQKRINMLKEVRGS